MHPRKSRLSIVLPLPFALLFTLVASIDPISANGHPSDKARLKGRLRPRGATDAVRWLLFFLIILPGLATAEGSNDSPSSRLDSTSAWGTYHNSDMNSVYIAPVDFTPFQNMDADIITSPDVKSGQNIPGNWIGIQTAWSGAVCRDLPGKANDELIVMGGGHNNSAWNGILAVNAQTGQWRREAEPSGVAQLWTFTLCTGSPPPPISNLTCDAPAPFKDFDAARATVYQDGRPVSHHTYSQLAYYAAEDKIYTFNTTPYMQGLDPMSEYCWSYDFDTGIWALCANDVPPTIRHTFGNAIVVGDELYLANPKGFGRMNLTNETWTTDLVTATSKLNADLRMAYDPLNQMFVWVGHRQADDTLYAYRLALSDWGKREPSVAATPPDTIDQQAPGFVYYPPARKIVGWGSGATLATYDVKMDSWDTISLTGEVTPGKPLRRGTYGRFNYCGDKLLNVNGANKALYYVSE